MIVTRLHKSLLRENTYGGCLFKKMTPKVEFSPSYTLHTHGLTDYTHTHTPLHNRATMWGNLGASKLLHALAEVRRKERSRETERK